MQETKITPLVLSEIASLWDTYMNDSCAVCVFKHFLKNVEDDDIRSVLEYALYLSEHHIKVITEIMEKECLSVPVGFGEGDINHNAPRLFTDLYYLNYLINMASFGLDGYSIILRYAARPDIREFFSKCIAEATDLSNKVVVMLAAKGVFVRAPKVEVRKIPVFPEHTSILKGLLIENPRPAFAREVTSLFSGYLIDAFLKATSAGFAQVAQSQAAREFMSKGKDMFIRHFQGFTAKSSKEDLPVPSSYESFVTESTVSPFSDKLMMFVTFQICHFGLIVDGSATSFSLRSDLTALHIKYGAEIAKYASNGLKLMINNGWFEQPPQVIKHEDLQYH